jgi:hypothetical protein
MVTLLQGRPALWAPNISLELPPTDLFNFRMVGSSRMVDSREERGLT